MSEAALEVELASLSVAGRRLLGDLAFRVSASAPTTVMGPSGSGKSALLAFVGGHLEPAFTAAGRVRLGGRDLTDLPAERRGVGLMFQDDLLFPHLTVGGNVAFGLDPAIRGRAARRAAVEQALGEADLVGFFDRDPATLSGGQRARVSLMRALAATPRALLLDEPFSRLDAALRDDIRRFVFSAAARRGLPVLLVTHDSGDAEAAAGPLIRIGARS